MHIYWNRNRLVCAHMAISPGFKLRKLQRKHQIFSIINRNRFCRYACQRAAFVDFQNSAGFELPRKSRCAMPDGWRMHDVGRVCQSAKTYRTGNYVHFVGFLADFPAGYLSGVHTKLGTNERFLHPTDSVRARSGTRNGHPVRRTFHPILSSQLPFRVA